MKNFLKRFEKKLPVDVEIRYSINHEGGGEVVYISADIVGLPRKIVDFYSEAGRLLGQTYRKFPKAKKEMEENRRNFLRKFTEEINKNAPVEYRNVSIGYYAEENF